MSGPYTVRIVMADGVARFLKHRKFESGWLAESNGSTYQSIKSARRAAKKYIGDGKHLGTFYADIQDNNDHERLIEI